jgi:hypothetical protein
VRRAVLLDAPTPARVLDALAAHRTTTVFVADVDAAFVQAAHDRGITVGVLLDGTHPGIRELVGTARAHTPPILVAAAFDDLGPEHAALVDDLDVIVTGPRSPTGYRLLAGCARGTEVVIRADRPDAHYAAAANGAGLAIRYDPSAREPFPGFPPFLADHDFAGPPGHDVAILYTDDSPPYRALVDEFASRGIPYDVVPFTDAVTVADLYDYDELILPAERPLTEGQVGALNRFLDGGGALVYTEAYVGAVDWSLRDRPNARPGSVADLDGLLPYGRQVEVAGPGITTTITRPGDDREALHVLNDGPPRDLTLSASLAAVHRRATAYHCDGTVTALDLHTEQLGHRHTVTFAASPYTVVLFES